MFSVDTPHLSLPQTLPVARTFLRFVFHVPSSTCGLPKVQEPSSPRHRRSPSRLIGSQGRVLALQEPRNLGAPKCAGCSHCGEGTPALWPTPSFPQSAPRGGSQQPPGISASQSCRLCVPWRMASRRHVPDHVHFSAFCFLDFFLPSLSLYHPSY